MRRLRAAVLGAGLTASVGVIGRTMTSPGSPRWTRTNYRRRPVSLTGGLATACGATAAAAGAGGRSGTAATLATAVAAVLGAWDDHTASAHDKGLRGHLRALAQGRLTTGGAKLLGISASALAGAAIARPPGPGTAPALRSLPARSADLVVSAGLIAGTANLLNLFDLRPGRALKVAGAISVPNALSAGPAAPLATGALAVIAASWRTEMAEQTMLGDTGANALGALVGTALAQQPDARVRLAALGVVVGLTVLSEKVSFSQVIERNPPLRMVDTWGRSG